VALATNWSWSHSCGWRIKTRSLLRERAFPFNQKGEAPKSSGNFLPHCSSGNKNNGKSIGIATPSRNHIACDPMSRVGWLPSLPVAAVLLRPLNESRSEYQSYLPPPIFLPLRPSTSSFDNSSGIVCECVCECECVCQAYLCVCARASYPFYCTKAGMHSKKKEIILSITKPIFIFWLWKTFFCNAKTYFF